MLIFSVMANVKLPVNIIRLFLDRGLKPEYQSEPKARATQVRKYAHVTQKD